MPLSVPLKTSRYGSRTSSHAHHTATQAAAQLAAEAGAKASPRRASRESAAAAEPPKPPSAPKPQIPPATGSVWGHGVSASSIASLQAAAFKPPGLANNTPQAVLRSFHAHESEREAKHLCGNGVQIVSTRTSFPSVSFHNGPSGRVVEEKSRCREIGEHPMLQNPCPQRYDIEPIQPSCMVPKGWLKEDRFKNSPFAVGEKSADNPTANIKFSTECHPMSSTYPYPEPTPRKASASSPVEVDFGDPLLASNSLQEASPVKPLALVDESLDRKNPIRTVDLNIQHFKYRTKPTWGFGSSGLGYRFNSGTAFSKKPDIKTHSRLQGFRELRENIPERSEKEYQEALDRALAEATAAAHASGASASAAPPAVEMGAAPTDEEFSKQASLGERKSLSVASMTNKRKSAQEKIESQEKPAVPAVAAASIEELPEAVAV